MNFIEWRHMQQATELETLCPKRALQEALAREQAEFLSRGGVIQVVKMGATAIDVTCVAPKRSDNAPVYKRNRAAL